MYSYMVAYRCIFFNRYTVSNSGIHKNYEEVTYESVDQGEIQYAKPDITSAPTTTAISMQENPAYEIHKMKTTT